MSKRSNSQNRSRYAPNVDLLHKVYIHDDGRRESGYLGWGKRARGGDDEGEGEQWLRLVGTGHKGVYS